MVINMSMSKKILILTCAIVMIFGFGLKLYKNNPEYFNKIKETWNKDLKDLEINIKSDLIIKSISSTENSVEVLDDKE